jgi:lysozyme family protein
MFAKIVNFILEREGGYVNHPNDRGGATNMGVTQRTLDRWCAKHGKPTFDVKDLDKPTAIQIYKEDYWKEEWEKLGFGMAACLFDTAVNSGMGRAESMRKQATDYVDYIQRRIAFYKAIIQNDPSQKVFEKGWMNRMTHLRRFIEVELEAERANTVPPSGDCVG